MSTRWRIFLAAVVLVVVPAGILAGFFRGALLESATDEFARDNQARMQGFLAELQRAAAANQRLMRGLAAAAADDNRLRLALVGDRDDLRPYLRDYATQVARTTSLDALALLDADGRILSSAHHRNEFGVSDAGLLQALGNAGGLPGTASDRAPLLERVGPVPDAPPPAAGTAFAIERTPSRAFLAVISRQDFAVGGRTFHWLGGWEPRLQADRLDIGLVTADTVFGDGSPLFGPGLLSEAELADWGRDRAVVWEATTVPLARTGHLEAARLVTAGSLQPLLRQRRQTEQLVLAILTAVLVGAFSLAALLSWQLSRPLADLAGEAERIDLDHPALDFATDRGDEVGQLARVLQAMVQRLRAGARRLADAERRATLGEVARQVNHDLRNGITPVRNVVRHLGETASEHPDQLADVFRQRRGTLDGSLAYLEELAGRYARLAPDTVRRRCDLLAIAREVAAAHGLSDVAGDPGAPDVLADPLSLRRILDNLLRNAREALPDGRGAIRVRVAAVDDPDLGPRCVLTVADDGCGMTPEVQARVLEDFFTTRAGGSGLGLSNVRRLAGDAGGQVRIDSAPGRGTTVTVTFPGAESDS
ncbi:MAG: HAMP domain-containing sensor histidine kinase [Candidatus Krumholzibacteriia bacterium]